MCFSTKPQQFRTFLGFFLKKKLRSRVEPNGIQGQHRWKTVYRWKKGIIYGTYTLYITRNFWLTCLCRLPLPYLGNGKSYQDKTVTYLVNPVHFHQFIIILCNSPQKINPKVYRTGVSIVTTDFLEQNFHFSRVSRPVFPFFKKVWQ